MIEHFWVTTIGGSVYHVNVEGPKPIVKKIKQLTNGKSEVAIGTVLEGSGCVGITDPYGIMVYQPQYSGEKRCDPDNTDIAYWGGCTGNVVGLFTSFDAATRDFNWNTPSQPWDWLYRSDTLKVLKAIPEDHPLIVIDGPVIKMLASLRPHLRDGPLA